MIHELKYAYFRIFFLWNHFKRKIIAFISNFKGGTFWFLKICMDVVSGGRNCPVNANGHT
jgi:hypothetical protein